MHLDFAGAGILIGLIALAASLFYAYPLKRQMDRYDRMMAEQEAKKREDERAAHPSA